MRAVRCATFDAYYDWKTGAWTEPRCDDRACAYCKDRPATHPTDHDCEDD